MKFVQNVKRIRIEYWIQIIGDVFANLDIRRIV